MGDLWEDQRFEIEKIKAQHPAIQDNVHGENTLNVKEMNVTVDLETVIRLLTEIRDAIRSAPEARP